MEFKTQNKYTVYFKDGTSFKSSGNSDGVNKSEVKKEFEWVAFHITKELAQSGKELKDVARIDYTLNYIE